MSSFGDTEPYHCLLDGSYHVLTDCPLGRQIPPELIVPGKGAATLCSACRERLEARGPWPTEPDDPRLAS